MSVEIIEISETIRARIEYDTDPMSPTEWSNLGEIVYRSDRHTLGTKRVSSDELEDISSKIQSGEYVGLPVYAHVHGGFSLSTGPFSCPWDSGQSGFVYCTKKKAIAEFGKKTLTARAREATLRCLKAEVETFHQYLNGDVYQVIIERPDGEHLDSCYGFYGLSYAIEEAKAMGAHRLEQDQKEATEALYWAERGVETHADF